MDKIATIAKEEASSRRIKVVGGKGLTVSFRIGSSHEEFWGGFHLPLVDSVTHTTADMGESRYNSAT